MSDWKAKRFWSEVSISSEDGAFGIRLDSRPVKTPAKRPLLVPTQSMADAIAVEWSNVVEIIDPNVMPVTRSANAAIDKVTTQFTEVADMIASYGGSDLLCYRADAPDRLVKRQTESWDPLLEWASQTYKASLVTTFGVMPIQQDGDTLTRLSVRVHGTTSFELAALHDLVSLSGSLVLGLAVVEGRLSPDDAWSVSRVDEDWQSEQWGEDEEAAEAAKIKKAAFCHAAAFHQLAQS